MKTYLRHKSMNVIDIKELAALEYLDFEGKYGNYEEKHTFWELCYVVKGEAELVLGKERVRLCENDMFLIPPDETHSYSSKNGNENKVFVVCFECSSLGLKTLGKNTYTLSKNEAEWFEKIIKESQSTFRINENDVMELLGTSPIGGQQVIIILLEYLILGILRGLSSEKNSEVVFLKEDKFYREITKIIIEYMKENIDKRIALEDICKKVNYSKSYVCKVFKNETGQSLISYYNGLKTEKAKVLLKETDESLSEISRKLGFGDDKYFREMFKNQTGITPAQYRKTAKEEKR